MIVSRIRVNANFSHHLGRMVDRVRRTGAGLLAGLRLGARRPQSRPLAGVMTPPARAPQADTVEDIKRTAKKVHSPAVQKLLEELG